MFQIKQPSHIIVGNHSCQNFHFDKNCLIITSKGAKKRGWLDYLSIKDYQLFDKVEPNPSLETVKNIIDQFSNSEITNVIGIGGGHYTPRFTEAAFSHEVCFGHMVANYGVSVLNSN